MRISRMEAIKLARQLIKKGGVGPKFVKMSNLKNDPLYRGLIKSNEILRSIR